MPQKHIRRASGWVLAVGLGMVAAACGADEPPPMTPASSVEPRLSALESVDAITNARCEHELKCGNVAATEDFQSREHCLQVMRADAGEELADADCRNGVAQRDLQQCLTEIANEDCGGVASVLDNLDTYFSCRAGSLCLD